MISANVHQRNLAKSQYVTHGRDASCFAANIGKSNMQYKKIYKRLVPLFLMCAMTSAAAEPATKKIPETVKYSPETQKLNMNEDLERAVAEVARLQLQDSNLVSSMFEQDLWARIRSGFAMSDVEQSSVDAQVRKFAIHPHAVERTSLRASKYLFHVVEEVDKRKLPMELALLPFIESAFNPSAYSSANASGMWQFVPATGIEYNLQQNRFKDDRRNVIASTDAALTYLEKLYGMFGDWQLALAAYNWGEGSVMKAIKKNQALGLPIDFDSLSARMPEETRTYVPKLLAMKEIISNPDKFGVTLPSMQNKPYFTLIQKTGDIDVKVAAELAEIPVKEFKELNPQFNKPVITGDSSTAILLPAHKADVFRENLLNWGKALTKWTSHTVTGAKERISAVAKKFGTTPEIIRAANNIPGRMEVAVGSTLLVPKLSASIGRGISRDISETAKFAIISPPKPKQAAKKSQRNRTVIAQSKQRTSKKKENTRNPS